MIQRVKTLPPSLTSSGLALGPSWWKERDDLLKLSSAHRRQATGMHMPLPNAAKEKLIDRLINKIQTRRGTDWEEAEAQ